MNKVKITIKLVMEVPDSWKLVNHPDDKVVLDTNDGRFLDMTFAPLITTQATSGAEWTSIGEDAFANSILGMIKESDTEMKKLLNQPS
jgi:hypothetical protein